MRRTRKIQSITICDTLAEGHGHLLKDDEFYVKTFLSRTEIVELYSSPVSCKLISQLIYANRNFTCHPLRRNHYFLLPHTIKILLRLLELPRRRPILFLIGFHEVGTAFFILLRKARGQCMVLVSTNNVSNVRRSKIKRRLLAFILERIQVLIVHSEWEKRFFSKLYPASRTKIQRIPYHRAGTSIPTQSGNRAVDIGYLGGARAEQGFNTVQQWTASPYLANLTFLIRFSKNQKGLLRPPSNASDRLTLLHASYDDAEYLQLFLRCRYILLPYTKDYIGKLSGIFCDAIATLTPVIAPQIPPFTEYFKEYGPLGILFDFTAPPSMALRDALESKCQYMLFRRNLRKAKASHSQTAIKETLQAVVDEASERRFVKYSQ